jgi:DNA-binding NarL/FixJ family response regulator
VSNASNSTPRAATVACIAALAAPMNHPSQTASAEAPSILRCFIVEDSPVILHGLVDTLEQLLPLKVVGSCGDQKSAVTWLDDHQDQYDLVITDIFLKQGTGLDVLKHLQALRGDFTKVVLTNYATVDMRQRCAALGADMVFDKSSELDELIEYCAQIERCPPTSHN